MKSLCSTRSVERRSKSQSPLVRSPHQWKVKRMKPARIAVLAIALVAGGIAALLAGRSDPPAPIVQVAAPQLETVEVLIAAPDIGRGHPVETPELRWQTWPAAAAGAQFIRKAARPDAISKIPGAITRQPFSAGEP